MSITLEALVAGQRDDMTLANTYRPSPVTHAEARRDAAQVISRARRERITRKADAWALVTAGRGIYACDASGHQVASPTSPTCPVCVNGEPCTGQLTQIAGPGLRSKV